MAELVDAAAGKLVHRHPLQFKLHIRAQHGLDTGNHFFWFLFFVGVSIPAQLEVDAPNVVGLFVQQNALALVEWWVKPEPALGRKSRLHDHIGNEEAVLKKLAGEVSAHHAAGVAVGTVGGNHPLCLQLENAIGCLNSEHGHI